MINAFRNSEVPVDDYKKVKDYSALQTGSEAILTTCSVIKNIVSVLNVSDVDSIGRLVCPLKILELLLHNNEQMHLALQKGEFIIALCTFLQNISDSKKARKVDHAATVALCARILAIVMNQEEA